jgi:hypothetical protein
MGVSCNGLQALDMGGRQRMPLTRGAKGARKVGQNRLFRPSKTKNRPELFDFILYTPSKPWSGPTWPSASSIQGQPQFHQGNKVRRMLENETFTATLCSLKICPTLRVCPTLASMDGREFTAKKVLKD